MATSTVTARSQDAGQPAGGLGDPRASDAFRREEMSSLSQPAMGISRQPMPTAGSATSSLSSDRNGTSQKLDFPHDSEEEDDGFVEELTRSGGACLSRRKLMSITGTNDLSLVTHLEVRIDAQQQSLNNFGTWLPCLKHLKLNGSTITSLRDLGSGLSNLEVLYIADCDLDSIDGVANMENLQELYAAFNYVDDLTALCGNEELRVVDLETNAITDVAQIGHLAMCPFLHSLTLVGNPCCTSPSSAAPSPMPGYDYVATVLQFMPGLRILDDEPTSRATVPKGASLQRPRAQSARARPLTASSSYRSDSRGVVLNHPRSSSGSRPLSAAQGSLSAVSSTELPAVDEGSLDDGSELQERSNALTMSGTVLQGNLSRALRARKGQHRLQTPSSTSSSQLDATSTQAKREGVPFSSSTVQPVVVDTSRERVAALDDLRQWHEQYSKGEQLLRQAAELSPVQDMPGPRTGARPPASSQTADTDELTQDRGQNAAELTPRDVDTPTRPRSSARRKLPKTPSLDGGGGLPLGVVPTPPKGPPPANRRLRPVTARPSLQDISGSQRAASRSNPPARERQARPQIETYIRASTEDQAPLRHRLRGGPEMRPSTAMGNKSGYKP